MFKYIKIALLAVLTITLAIACQSDSTADQETTTQNQVAKDALSFGRATFNEISKSCVTDSVLCAKATVSYPTARGGDEGVAEKINATIRAAVASSVGLYGESDSIQLSPQAAAKVFVAEYDEYLAESKDAFAGWASETNGEVLYQDDKNITIELDIYAFTGGAHPNSYVRILNFATETGELIEPMDLIADTTALKQLAEKAFRAEREIAPDQDLQKEGFWFENGFTLPQEMGLVKDGLKLYYNTYEVAPYVMSSTAFVIPQAELKGMIKE